MQLALAATTWPRMPERATVLVPVGSTEQHGPHLPLNTDTEIAVAVAESAAKRLRSRRLRIVVAPALNFGSSGEHQDFAGTSSIGTDALQHVIVELTRSMRNWARRVVFVNGHGGNVEALRRAVTQLQNEGHDVAWVPCATEGVDLHAGRTETSLMLHIAPWNVRMQRAEVGNLGTVEELLPILRQFGVKSVSPNGVLGDPRGASAAEGERLLDIMVGRVASGIMHDQSVPAP